MVCFKSSWLVLVFLVRMRPGYCASVSEPFSFFLFLFRSLLFLFVSVSEPFSFFLFLFRKLFASFDIERECVLFNGLFVVVLASSVFSRLIYCVPVSGHALTLSCLRRCT